MTKEHLVSEGVLPASTLEETGWLVKSRPETWENSSD